MGGDEFSVLFKTTEPSELLGTLNEFREQFCKTNLDSQTFKDTTISIGVALSSTDGIDSRSLLTAADGMLYVAKESGRNQIAYEFLAQSGDAE
jgi:diguanylate cyclase (GGDEF)-like protein